MSPRKPNMLEAFQASAKVDQTRQEEARTADSLAQAGDAARAGDAAQTGATGQPGADLKGPPSSSMLGAGGPFASASGARRQTARPSAGAGGNASGGTGRMFDLSTKRLPLVIGLVLLGMIAMFFLGRGFARESRAADPALIPAQNPEVRVPLAERSTASEPSPAGEGTTSADQAFLDRSNRLSVRAIQFANDSHGKQRAGEVHRYLLAQGLPAVTPIDQGQILVICVGAEPSRNGKIERIRATLRALKGPPPLSEPGAFGSAYFVNIADQIDDSWRH